MSNLNFFSHAVLPSQTSRILDKTQKILGPKINPSPPPPHNPQPNPSRNSLSPEIFREGLNDTAHQKMESNCLWFVYLSYHMPNLSFLIWQSELRGQHCTRAVLNQFLLKSRYHKTFIYIYICQIFPSPKKSPNEKFQNKKEIPWSSW